VRQEPIFDPGDFALSCTAPQERGGLQMKIYELVEAFGRAGESDHPMNAAREVLESLRGRVEDVEKLLSYIPGTGGNPRQVFYRSPQLTLLKVCFPVGRRTPPHTHGTWAAILQLSGEEKNTLYDCEHGKLRKTGEVTLARGTILPLGAGAVHVVECRGGVPSIGLHVYGGDVLSLPRRMWNPETLEEHPLDWALYESFAEAASKAASAPLN
jgi:predicted metal-dependent enzyme (double-stranded beta helix superfamily)